MRTSCRPCISSYHPMGRQRTPKCHKKEKEKLCRTVLTCRDRGAKARLLLHHDDALSAQALETEYMVFMQGGKGSMVETMMKISAEWHQKVGDGMANTRSPLRLVMAHCLRKELEVRSGKALDMEAGIPLRQELIRTNLLNAAGTHW